MNELSLFTGAGGGIWGTKLLGWRCLGYVEINEYCQRVIAQRIADGFFEPAPTFGDIQAFCDQGYARRYRGMVDVITAGFPCTPWSVAGKRRGEADSRNLWPATIATIREVRPRFAYMENVPALLSSGYFGRILGDLAESGYDTKWCVLGANDVGAPHRRKRLWILAHTQYRGRREGSAATGRTEGVASDRLREGGLAEVADARHSERWPRESARGYSEQRKTPGREEGADSSRRRSQVADSEGVRWRQGRESEAGAEGGSPGRCAWWDIDPADLADAEDSDRGRAGREEDTRGRASQTGGSDRTIREGPVESRVGKLVDELADRKRKPRATDEGESS